MTYEEILDNAQHLPLVERLRLVEALSRSVRQSVAFQPAALQKPTRREEPWQEGRHELLGILRTDAPPPTDEEIREEYYAYLEKKYS